MEDEPKDMLSTPTPSVTARLSAISTSETVSELLPQNGIDGNLHQQEASSLAHKQTVAPSWAEMLPDALANIFSRLSVKELLCTIPAVCRYWQCVSKDASCWHTIHLSEWSYFQPSKTVEKLLLLLIDRSQGGLRRVCVPNLQNDNMLQFIVNSASQLQELQIPDSLVSEECLCEVAPKARSLTFLDISGHFPSKALLESFGKHCKFITRLNINMGIIGRESKSCDIAALAIAEYMPQLQHLEMAYGLLSAAGLRALLEQCRELQHLDLRGCRHLDVEDRLFVEARKHIKVFLSPVVEDHMYDHSGYDIDDEDDYDCMFGNGGYYEFMNDDLHDFFYLHDDWIDPDEMVPF